MRRRTGCGIFRWSGITIHAALGAGVGGNKAVDEARPTRARIEISPHLLTNAFHGLHLRLPRIADWGNSHAEESPRRVEQTESVRELVRREDACDRLLHAARRHTQHTAHTAYRAHNTTQQLVTTPPELGPQVTASSRG